MRATMLLMLALAPLALAADAEPGAKLAGKLVVRDVQGGFAGFTGTVYTVDADGSYTVGREARRKVTETAKGKLDAKALAKLAGAVKKYDAATLKSVGNVKGNPRVITITYGKNTATLKLLGGGTLPKVDEKGDEGRFAGIVAAVVAAIPKAGEKKAEEK
jgi:hypothetical protein